MFCLPDNKTETVGFYFSIGVTKEDAWKQPPPNDIRLNHDENEHCTMYVCTSNKSTK